jgi:hypothetical protein
LISGHGFFIIHLIVGLVKDTSFLSHSFAAFAVSSQETLPMKLEFAKS